MELGGVRLVAERLLELDLRGVEAADDHQVAAEDLVRFGVADVELSDFASAWIDSPIFCCANRL